VWRGRVWRLGCVVCLCALCFFPTTILRPAGLCDFVEILRSALWHVLQWDDTHLNFSGAVWQLEMLLYGRIECSPDAVLFRGLQLAICPLRYRSFVCPRSVFRFWEWAM
jgi:hypothetical protein